MSDEKCKNCGFPVSPQIVIGGTPGPQGPKGDTPDMSEYAKKTEIPIKVSDLDNDSDFVSRSVADLENYYVKTQTYTREEINQKIGAIKTASFEVVDTLPASGEENIIYLVPKVGGEVPDTHDEYIWVDGTWELIGSTQIDLSNYLQKTGDASDTTVTFVSESGEPTSGSSLSSLIGRIVKKLSNIISGAIPVAKATSATKTEQDADGNKISDTYLKRSGGTMTGNLGLSNEGHVNGAVGNLIGRFTWAGGLKAVVGNAQDTLALLSKDAATLNGSPIITGKGGLVSGLITGSNVCYTHHNVAGLSSTQHTGWIDIDFGTRQAMYTGSIRMYMYGKGVIDLLFEGYLYDQGSGQYVWASPAFGFSGSLSSALPQVRFVRDGDGGGHILLGGDGYTWGLQSSVVIREITLGNSAYNGANPLSITITKSTGDFSTLGMTDAVINPIGTVPSQGIEVERARKDGDGNKISETYLKRSGGTMTGTLVQKKGNCSIHTDVASYRIPSQHKGWIALDCGLGYNIALVGYITLYKYYTGALSIQVSGYTYAEGIALTRDNWITPRYGIHGSWYGDMPQVAFVKDGTTGRRYIIIGGDDFEWNTYDYVSLDKVVLGSLGNKTEALPFTWSALSGTSASLGLVAATAGDMSQGVEVQRARQDKDGNDIPSTYATKAEVSSLFIGGCNYITGLKDNWDKGFVSQTNGTVTTADNYNVVTKDYQDISPLAGKRATISASDAPIDITGSTYYFSLRYAFYDTDKNFISGGATDGKTPSIVSMDVPATAAYIKVSAGVGAYNYAFNNFEAIRLKLELGDYATDYSLAPQDIPTVNDLPDVYVDTVPSNPKDGDILITTTD